MRDRLIRAAAFVLALALCGCTVPVDSTAPGAETSAADVSAAVPDMTTDPTPAVSTTLVTPGPADITYADPDVALPDPYPEGPAGVPVCGYPLPPLSPAAPTVSPPTDECLFTGMSPTCPLAPTEVIDNGTTRPADPTSTPTGTVTGGFGRWGGQEGGAMCISEYADGAVVLTNNERVLLVEDNAGPLIFAGRIDLARSSGVWGLVSLGATEVRISDPSQPSPSLAPTRFISGGAEGTHPVSPKMLRVFIVPVSSGPVTITVTNGLGEERTNVVIP